MAQKNIQGSKSLADKIKKRRNELSLTIEEAALNAGVGTKTWSRYESGCAIRKDKVKGICKALNWFSLSDDDTEENAINENYYRNSDAWSKFLETEFGEEAAMSFAAGSEMLWDHITEDLEALSSMPKGTHIGQLSFSWVCDYLPEQFLMYYDYDFLFKMKCTLNKLIMRAHYGSPMTAHSVLQELIIYICNEEATALSEIFNKGKTNNNMSAWIFDLFDDMDIVTFLYSDIYLTNDNPYHYSHWDEEQFFTVQKS